MVTKHVIKPYSYHLRNAFIHFPTIGVYAFSKITMSLCPPRWYRLTILAHGLIVEYTLGLCGWAPITVITSLISYYEIIIVKEDMFLTVSLYVSHCHSLVSLCSSLCFPLVLSHCSLCFFCLHSLRILHKRELWERSLRP